MHVPLHPIRRLGLATAAAVLLGLATALPASAHVHADGSATVGGWAVITFRVPTESDTASTTSLTVQMPAGVEFASVSTQVKPGWTAKLEQAELATPIKDDDGNEVTTYVKSVTWTATGDGIKPTQFDTFAISVGPVPDVHSLVFPTLQGYSDGSKVDWSEMSQGGAEPEHPAPEVAVGAAASEDPHGSPAPSSSGPTATASTPMTDGHQGMDMTPAAGPDPLGVAGIVVGGLGLVLAAVALVRSSGRAGR